MSHARRRPPRHDPRAVHGPARAVRAGARRARSGRSSGWRSASRSSASSASPGRSCPDARPSCSRRSGSASGWRVVGPILPMIVRARAAEPPGGRNRRVRRRLRHRRDRSPRPSPCRSRTRFGGWRACVRERLRGRLRLARRVARAHARATTGTSASRPSRPKLPWRRPSAWLLGRDLRLAVDPVLRLHHVARERLRGAWLDAPARPAA